MRAIARVVLTLAGVLVILVMLGSVAAAVVGWTVGSRCFKTPGTGGFCVRDYPASELSHGPWWYIGLAGALFLLGVGVFTLRERIRARS